MIVDDEIADASIRLKILFVLGEALTTQVEYSDIAEAVTEALE